MTIESPVQRLRTKGNKENAWQTRDTVGNRNKELQMGAEWDALPRAKSRLEGRKIGG